MWRGRGSFSCASDTAPSQDELDEPTEQTLQPAQRPGCRAQLFFWRRGQTRQAAVVTTTTTVVSSVDLRISIDRAQTLAERVIDTDLTTRSLSAQPMTEGERLLIVEAPFTFTEIGKLENFARNLSWFMRRYPNTILLVVRGNGVRYVSQLPAPYWLQATYVYSLSWAAFEQKYLLGTAAAALPMAREKDAAAIPRLQHSPNHALDGGALRTVTALPAYT